MNHGEKDLKNSSTVTVELWDKNEIFHLLI